MRRLKIKLVAVVRIAINLHGFSLKGGGVATYLLNLLTALQQVDKKNEYVVLCNGDSSGSLKLTGSNFSKLVSHYEYPRLRWFARGAVQHFFDYDLLARTLQGVDVDLVHHPLTILNPRGLPQPSVLTFHDMQQEYLPELFSTAELRRRRKNYLMSAQEARAIIAISEYTKNGLIERYGVNPSKVHVVHHGLSGDFQPISDPVARDRIIKKYALVKPFMIYPASTWLHKNHLRLLAVVRCLVDSGHFDGELLLTGVSMDAHGSVLSEISRLRLESSVRWLGYLPSEDIPNLYSLARLMVFPSLFEGFGLPVIEAMACGCPVVCANVTSLPEVAGDAALFFDPESEDEVLGAIETLWDSDQLRGELRSRGLQHARQFSWESSAKKTVNVYRSVS